MSLIENISESLSQKPPRKKGGRPRKQASELRNYGVTIWFAHDEYFRLKDLAEGTNLTVREIIRQTVNSNRIVQISEKNRLKTEDLILCKELIKVAANINQITKALNDYRYNMIEIESVQSIYNRLMQYIKILQQ